MPSATAAIASLPSVSGPGEKLGPTALIPTKAEAQRTTVTTTAAMPSLLIWPGRTGRFRDAAAGACGGTPEALSGCGVSGWLLSGWGEPVSAVVAMLPI
jgi:hypothetical protein